MPLTALAAEEEIDATSCSTERWATIHRVRPRVMLICRGCGHTMQAKVSSLSYRFFAHDREQSSCPSAGETAEHRELKRTIAEAARRQGHEAELEVAGKEPGHPERGWRTDVLVISSSGRRIAFEVQLASLTKAAGAERTRRMRASGIDEVIWVAIRHPAWYGSLPAVRLAKDEVQGHFVVSGAAAWDGKSWFQRPPFAFEELIADLASGSIISYEAPRAVGEEFVRTSGRVDSYWTYLFVATGVDIEAARSSDEALWREFEKQEREWMLEAARRERADRNLRLLLERQARLVPVAAAMAAAETRKRVWVGDPPVTPGEPHRWGEDVAHGISIWTGWLYAEKRWAVVCPVATRIERASFFRLREVEHVFVATANEQHYVDQALNRTALHRKIEILSTPPASSSST